MECDGLQKSSLKGSVTVFGIATTFTLNEYTLTIESRQHATSTVKQLIIACIYFVKVRFFIRHDNMFYRPTCIVCI